MDQWRKKIELEISCSQENLAMLEKVIIHCVMKKLLLKKFNKKSHSILFICFCAWLGIKITGMRIIFIEITLEKNLMIISDKI